MKKNSRLKSFFAILLAVSMIFQQSSLTVLATDDTYVEDATATPTPSENEAETYATEGAEPVAEKQEEPQQVQETPVAEQAQEPTEAPAEQPTEAPAEQPTETPAEQPTEAPAEQPTEAPAAAPTETPATEPTAAPAEVTEAPAAPEATATPAAEATATPTPEVSASPSETPTPTEAPKTSFRYEDSRVVITATAPEDANLPQDAEIKADYIAPGTNRYNAAVAAFNSQLSSQLGLDDENTEAEYVLYDVYFLIADGSRIEPESGNVKVDMSFKKIQESTVDGDVVNKDVVHLDNDGQAEVVTAYVNTNADGEITSMGFTQDSFSIVGGVTTTITRASNPNVITSVALSFKENGESGSASIDSIKSGKEGYLFASIGMANNNDHIVTSDVEINLGKTNAKFPDFVNNTYVANGITYTLSTDADGNQKIKVEGLTENGSTQLIKMRVKFPEGVSSSKDDINASFTVDGENKANASLKCEAEPKWHHKKTADNVSIGTTGTTTSFVMKDDLKFTLHEYHDEIKEGNLWLKGFTITDTMRFPEGMYINKDDADAAISFENMDGYKKNLIYDKNDSNKVVGYTITYTKSSSSEDPKKQLDDWAGKVIVSKDKIKFVENYVDGEVSNELETTVSPIDNSADIKLADKAKATVLVKKPGEIDFRDNNNNNKSILHVETAKPGHWNDYNQNNSYVLYGDYILYQVKATNNGDVDTDIVIEDDLTKVSPARSLAFITEDELNTLSTNGQWNVGGNAFTPSKRIWTKADSPIKATAEIAGDKATWKFESVPSGKEVLGYVLMKVVQNETQEITNQITINNDKATKTNTVKQKKDEEKMEVTKTASAEPIVDGKEEYTITIKNTGTAAASGWKFSDVLPAGMELDGTVAKVTIEGGSFTSEVTYDSVTGEIAGTLADIQPGGSVTIKVPVKLKSNSTEESFKNVAQVIKGEHVVKGEVTVHKNSRNFDITKTADRTLADSEDLVKYTITVKNTGISSSVLTENEPLAFWDIPNGITIEENKQSDKFVENKPNDVTIERVYEKDGNGKITKVIFKAVGTFKTGESASVNVWATMPKVETGSVKVKNTAEIDENHKSDSEIVVEPSQGDSTETKVVYDKDGNPLPNPGVVSVGDVLTYKITVKNTGKSNITEVYGKDTLVNKDNSNGATHQVDDANNNYQLILTVEEAEEVTGINKGDKLVINKWDVKDFSFLITTNSNSQKSADVIKKIEDFSIAPNGKLVLSYKLKLKDNFKDSYNQVSINGHEPVTSFEYTTAEGKLDVFKYAGGSLGEGNSFEPNNLDKTFSLNPNDYSSAADLQNKLIIPYVVVVKNLSEKGGSQILDDFVVTDTLPEGLEWVKYDETKDVLVKVAADNNKNTWDSESSWGKVSASVSGNTITTRFSKAVQGYNGDKICLLIFYKARLTSEKAEEIYKKLKDSKDSLVLETFKNTATLKATKPFINSEGKVGTETSDSDNFTIEEDTTHISFEKAAEGCYAGGEDYNGQLTTIGGTAGSKIVWKLVINNDTYGNGGAALTNYSILDTLPSGYQYQQSETGEYENTMVVYKKSDGKVLRKITFVEPTIDKDKGTIAWAFDTAKNSDFKLRPGEYLEIKYATSIKSTDDSKDGIYTNHAKLTVHGYTEPGTVPGEDGFNKEYEDSASYTLSSVATSSVKTIAYNRHANHKKDPKDDTGSGDRPMPENYVEGMQGEDVTYTLNVKNEATTTTIANMVVIDRLPYVGDIGVIAGYGRGSAFEVSYNGGLAVSADGSTIKGVTVQFSSDASTTIGDGAGEWSTEKDNDTVEWHNEYQAGDRLIRFQFPADFKLPAGKTVTIQFNGKVPEYVENTGESNIAWNSFAYSYTDEGKTSGILIAEPAKVGVWVKTPESGKITVNKTFKSENTERTFYFAVFTRNENDEFVRYSPVKSLTLTGTTAGTTESVVFNNLPLGEENETIYYVFETDAQGIIPENKDGKVTVNGINYTVTGQGQNVVLSAGEKERVVPISNEEEQKVKITVTKTDDWKWKFADQPKYEKGQEIEYTITEDKVDGYITAQGIGNYDVVNTPTTVTVDKVDDEGNPVKNAKLQISVKDDNGNVVASWKTDDTSYDIIGKLIAGNTYTLEEINVPTGYVAADPITFKVEADGTITVDNETIVGNKLTLVDAKLHFNVNKVELGSGKEVEGAHLVVIDKETGKTVDEWVSEKGKTHDFGPKLEAGKSYILRETVAPAGYKYATDIEFTVKKDGTIETNAKTTTDTDGNKVYLVEDDTTKVTITKVDALGNQLSGVVLEIQDKDGVVIDSWTTSTKDNPRVITGKLILGETYKLVEKSAPAGYTLADPVEFTVSENDIDNKVEMKNTYSASGSLNLTAKKTLTTTETPLTEGQFTFELRDKDGTVLQTKTNDADGNVTFDEIKYSLVKDNTDKKVDDTGEYQYTVNEVKGDAAGYTYDDTIYTINATVTDAGNGTLTVTPVIHSSKATSEDATVTGMEFTNTYTTSGQIALGATKTLEGQTLEAEQFSFQATEMDADGKAVENGYNETVKNADGGTITFPIITYKESGTHYYQITEVKDEKPAYQYDESKYVVKVDVTDDNAGKLTAKVTSVTKNGEPVKSEDLTGAVTFTNTYSASADLELKAQKSMKVEAEQLGTFEFELKDADGKVIETVKNDEKGAISFSKLSYTEKDAGKTFTYTVNEKLPSEADTYVYDKTVYTVTVNVEDNRDGTLKLTTKVNGEDYTETAMKFVNDTTKVTISKVDDTTLKALAGAKLQVVDDQDKVVEEWTSDGTPHVITAKLVLGKTYKLVEAEAPSGYEIAEPITFTVDADDTKNAVEMKDAMTKSKTAAIEITKELKLNDALAGAKDMTFYAALFADAECTIPASDVKALEFKNASSSTVTFTNLDLGRTYYVSETDVTGKAIDSGMTPDEKVYVPVYPQGQAITVTEDGAKSSITFENQFSEWPDGFYKIATLNVTKKLLGADGNALESDEIFYAGIFDDKECTTLSTRTEKNILTLDLAGGSTVSESTQAVVIPDEAFTLYVAETDAEGNLVDGTDGFRYAVTVENGNVLFDENNLNAEVTIINQKQPEATPTVTPEETITPTPTPGTSTGVKTGDDTPIGFYMALFFVAALAIEETTRRRRKKEQD